MRRAVAAASASASAATAKKGSLRGVYQRQPGRWAVDFRDHRLNVRRWLGTFPSLEEAVAAHDAFELQVRASAVAGAKISQPARRTSDGRKKQQQPPENTTTTITTSTVAGVKTRKSARRASGQPEDTTATTMAASLTSESSVSVAATPQNTLPHVVDPFLKEDQLAADGYDRFGFGLADLGHLPLPFLDGNNNMDFQLADSDLSLFDIRFL